MAKGRADFLRLGDWNAACSMCGRKRKASEMVKNWQGYWRCPEHNEPRQPQDFVKGEADIQTPPWTQPETDINIEICTYNGLSAIPGYAIPGCSIPGRTLLVLDDPPPLIPKRPLTQQFIITAGQQAIPEASDHMYTGYVNSVGAPGLPGAIPPMGSIGQGTVHGFTVDSFYDSVAPNAGPTLALALATSSLVFSITFKDSLGVSHTLLSSAAVIASYSLGAGGTYWTWASISTDTVFVNGQNYAINWT